MENLEKAKALLTGNNTLVVVKNDSVICSDLNGIKPLINLLENNVDPEGYSLADEIIGKAQAMLIVKAKIKEAYSKVMSEEGVRILKKYNIPYSYETLTKEIINRKGTDICPMEKAVKDVEDIEEAYELLKEKVLTI